MHSRDQFAAIHELQRQLADSRKDHEAAARRVPDERVREMLLAFSSEHALMENELASDLHQHGRKPGSGKGTLGGSFHRMLLGARDILNSTSEVNVLVECERHGAQLLARYNAVLAPPGLNEGSRAILARQRTMIEKEVEKIRHLRKDLETAVH